MSGKVLVAGIGNVFLGDDGFGVEVVGRLLEEEHPAGVRVADFGVRGVHLAYELMNGYDAVVLVDVFAPDRKSIHRNYEIRATTLLVLSPPVPSSLEGGLVTGQTGDSPRTDFTLRMLPISIPEHRLTPSVHPYH